MTAQRIAPQRVSESAVLSKADYFAAVHIWPSTRRLDARAWLKNFSAAELDHATAMLNAFLYFSAELTKALLASAFQNLSVALLEPALSARETGIQWNEFKKKLLLTYVEGEKPHLTDSGLLFSRLARGLLQIKEEQIVTPAQAVRICASGANRPVIFVDDFVGSGQQMLHTWNREYDLAAGVGETFQHLAQEGALQATYIPCIATADGAKVIRSECSGLTLLPAHELDPREGLLHSASLAFPPDLLPTAKQMIFEVSTRAGFSADEWQGFDGLGLALAFDHSTPDATLPIFYKETKTWSPLIRNV